MVNHRLVLSEGDCACASLWSLDTSATDPVLMEVGDVTLPGGGTGLWYDSAVHANLLAAVTARGVWTVDLSNPDTPVPVSFNPIRGVKDVVLEEGLLHVATAAALVTFYTQAPDGAADGEAGVEGEEQDYPGEDYFTVAHVGNDLLVSVQVPAQSASSTVKMILNLPPGWFLIDAEDSLGAATHPVAGSIGEISFSWEVGAQQSQQVGTDLAFCSGCGMPSTDWERDAWRYVPG